MSFHYYLLRANTSYSFVSLPFCTYFSTAAARSAFCRPSLLKPSSLSSVFCKSLNTADLDSYFTASKCAFSTSTMSTKRVLVPIADGSEEIESVCIIDVLRRAGAEVVVASVMDSQTVSFCYSRLVIALPFSDVTGGRLLSQSEACCRCCS